MQATLLTRSATVVVASILIAHPALAQSTDPALFVANNGNLEGSVTSFTINSDGTLNFVQKVVTGTTPSTSQPVHGTNCYSIAISPNGQYLVIGHASGTTGQWLTFLEVHSDATISILDHHVVPNTPLDVIWIDDEHVAATESNASALPSRVRVYRYTPGSASLIQTAIQTTGAFSTSLAIDRDRGILFTQATSGSASPNQVSSWQIQPGGTLTHIQTIPTGSFPMGLGVSPNGQWLYGAGGISSGGKAVVGATVDPNTGALALMPNSPFTSDGSSPKQIVVSPDGNYAIVGHGTDATVRTMSINQATGALASTGSSYKVGGQGDLGLIDVLGNKFFTTRRYSSGTWGPSSVLAFTIDGNGTITHVQTVSSQGIHPHDVATWPGLVSPCPGDINGDGVVNVFDVLALLSAWGPNPGHPADLNGDGTVNVFDLLELLGAWGPCD